jgi:CheY-like chemotaxis protein
MTPRVLIAEDDPSVLLIATAALQRAGLAVIPAVNGLEALTKAEREHPALIVLDCMMPELDGFETCACLQANPETSRIPVVFLTGKQDAAARDRCFALGAVACISKPFDPLRLGDAVRAFLPRAAGTPS